VPPTMRLPRNWSALAAVPRPFTVTALSAFGGGDYSEGGDAVGLAADGMPVGMELLDMPLAESRHRSGSDNRSGGGVRWRQTAHDQMLTVTGPSGHVMSVVGRRLIPQDRIRDHH